jgi:hypothetical protein
MLDGDVRPQPVPVFDAERNVPLHALQQSRAQASSLPNLRAMQAGTPVGSIPPSQRSLRRENSEGALRQRDSPAGSQRGNAPARGWQQALQPAPSGRGTPAQQGGRIPSGPGTPARGPSGRGTPSGNRQPAYGPPGNTLPPGQYVPATGDYAPPGNYGDGSYGPPPGGQYYAAQGEPPGMSGRGRDTYGDAGRDQYYEQYRTPQENRSQVPPVQLPPGDYGDGYIPEGYMPG